MIDVAKLHDAANLLSDTYPGTAQYEAYQALLKANNNLCAQLAEVVIERDRLRAANKDCMAWFEDAKHEAQMANDALKLYRADRDYAHRLAVMLECVLLGGKGTWDAGHALLDEYRESCRVDSEMQACNVCCGRIGLAGDCFCTDSGDMVLTPNAGLSGSGAGK